MKVEKDSLELVISLFKDGCEWHGDTLSHKWIECLEFSEDIEDRVRETISRYDTVETKIDGGTIWIGGTKE